nr:S53 family peptidase [Chromobacterium sp. ASV5]
MANRFKRKAATAAIAATVSATALAASPALDLGKIDQAAPAQTLTVTVALPLRDRNAATRYLTELHTSGSPHYHKFLTPAEFRGRFGPDEAAVAAISGRLTAAGLVVARRGSALLQVRGPAASVQRAFGAELHLFQARDSQSGGVSRFMAPAKTSQPAVDLSGVQAVIGLDSRPRFRPHVSKQPAQLARALVRASGASGGNAPGKWTVTDLARYYNVAPLYDKGINGKGATIGIVTLAAFTPADAFRYWNQLGLKTNPDRLTVVNVDGGPGAPSDDSQSVETTLDVEQSGGLAPGAKMIVYQAPNTTQGFVDAFAQAIENNAADAVSTSWGSWEWGDLQTAANDPVSGGSANVLQTYHDLFLQAAMQGQSLFAAAGDAGAYDVNAQTEDPKDGYHPPKFSKVLSVDSPASQQFITAAGGTTLAASLTFKIKGEPYMVTVPAERAWGEDYLTGLCKKLGLDPVSCNWPNGGGGGVSGFIPRPFYQSWLPGMQNTQPGQQLVDNSQTPPQVIAALPASYPGRNVPDISMNADPQTGYVVYYTSDKTGFSVLDGEGGTSFVAPQLAGIAALLNQSQGSRLGLLNFALYGMASTGYAYTGFGGIGAPLRDIRVGNNWFYASRAGYDQATGLGVPDVANLAAALKRWF